MTVAVATAVAAATHGRERVGRERRRVRRRQLDGPARRHRTPTTVAAQIAAARERFGDVEVITHRSVAVPGSASQVDVRSQDPSGAVRPAAAGPALRALPDRGRRGRPHAGHRRPAVGATSATRSSSDAADRAAAGRRRPGREPEDLSDEFALIAPDETAPADSLTLLFDSSRRSGTTPQQGGSASLNFPVVGQGRPGSGRHARARGDDAGHGARRAHRRGRLRRRGATSATPARPARRHRGHRAPPAAGHGRHRRHRRGRRRGGGRRCSGSSAGSWPRRRSRSPSATASIGSTCRGSTIAMILVLAVVTATAAAWWPARSVARHAGDGGALRPADPTAAGAPLGRGGRSLGTAGGMWAISAVTSRSATTSSRRSS